MSSGLIIEFFESVTETNNVIINGLKQVKERLYQCNESEDNGIGTIDNCKWLIATLNKQIVGYIKLSGDKQFSSISYIARDPNYKKYRIGFNLIKYLQKELKIKQVAAGIVSKVPEKIERLLLSTGFERKGTVFSWINPELVNE